MEVEYSLDMEDLLAFNLHVSAHSGALRRQRLRARWLLPLVCLAIWLALLLWVPPLQSGAWLAYGGSLCVLLGIWVVLVPVLLRRACRLVEGVFNEARNRAFFARRRLTITPETITDATEISVRTTKWVAVEKIAVELDHAYFFDTALTAIILSKAAFATEEGFQELVETAQRYRSDAPG